MTKSWIREDGDPESPWAAFLLGFATHGALDRATHPFIVYFSGWMDVQRPETERYRGCHAFLERILDILAWERATGSPVSSFDAERLLIPPEGFPPSFAERLSEALRLSYPSEAERDALLSIRTENALSDSLRFYSLTNPSRTSRAQERLEAYRHLDGSNGPRVVSVIYPEEFSRSVDWVNEGGQAWTHPCLGAPEEHASFYSLCDKAQQEAAGVLKTLLGCFEARSVPPDLQIAAGNATLNIGDREGRPARPQFCRPLPLPEALAAEFRMRMDRARRLGVI